MKENSKSNNYKVRFRFDFVPLKPFKEKVQFIISLSGGGNWKYKMLFEASEPDFFDTLIVRSKINVRKAITFRLFNYDKKNSSSYNAYFTNESDPEFMVSPKKGILEPMIKDGSLIEVSYMPTQYGKEKHGVLIVETENFYWRFQVKGEFEKYIPPKGKGKLKNILNR